jgi:hypothetical protein
MKMKATIEVEFEASPGHSRGALEAALVRGIGGLKQAIEYGSGGGQTGIKRGADSTRVEITQREIIA